MTKRRFIASGKITNYEMHQLRAYEIEEGFTHVRFNFLWASLSDQFHPHNQEEWDRVEAVR